MPSRPNPETRRLIYFLHAVPLKFRPLPTLNTVTWQSAIPLHSFLQGWSSQASSPRVITVLQLPTALLKSALQVLLLFFAFRYKSFTSVHSFSRKVKRVFSHEKYGISFFVSHATLFSKIGLHNRRFHPRGRQPAFTFTTPWLTLFRIS